MQFVLALLFFFSGASALIYQVVWLRMLALVFGVTSFAVATVLTAFMAGLSLGSIYGGRLADRRADSLLVFACLQLGIGVFALLFPFLYDGMTPAYIALYRHWPADTYLFGLVRFVISFALLLIPTTLMGATLPVVVKIYTREPERIGTSVGLLYSVNNWGAVAGGLTAGFFLIEALGVPETLHLAAAVSLAIGACAFLLRRLTPQRPTVEEAVPIEPEGADRGTAHSSRVLRVILWVFAIQGFTSLAYEVVWTRILASSLIATTTYAYSLVVATFIAGLALGSILIGRLADGRRDLVAWLAGIEAAIGVTAFLLLPLFHSSALFGELVGVSGAWTDWIGATALWVAVLMLVPTTLMGATFPLVGRIYAIDFREFGARIGRVCCLDTVGSIFGAFAGGFLLVPFFGTQESILLLATLNVGLGLWIVLSHPSMARTVRTVSAGALALAAGLAWVWLPHHAVFRPWWQEGGDIARRQGWYVIDYHEGIGSSVTVSRTYADDARLVQVDGADVAGTGRPLETTQISQAHLPLLIFEAQNGTPPERALTIGLGSGGTSWSLSRHDLKAIHCVELLPGIRRAAGLFFRDVNHDVFSDPRYRLIIQDARAYVLATEERYDVIMDDSVHPGFQGNASLYSRDFFRECSERLTEHGVMSVWLPVFLISDDDLRMIFKGFQDVFPHATLWRLNNDTNIHMVLIGTRERLDLEFEAFRRRAEQPKIQRDLARVDIDDPYLLVNSLLLDEDALREYCGKTPAHCDDYPRLEFSCARSFRRFWGRDPWPRRIERMRSYRSSILGSLHGLGNSEEEIARTRERLGTAAEVERRLAEGYLALSEKRYREAVEEGMRALELWPGDRSARVLVCRARYALADREWREGRPKAAQADLRGIIAFDADFFDAYDGLARCAAQGGNIPEAVRILEAGLDREPWHASRRYWLAGLYAREGRRGRAREELEKVLEAFPGEPMATVRLAELDSR